MEEQRRQYKKTEYSIINPESASSTELSELLSEWNQQKENLQQTRKHIASLLENGIQVGKK